MKIRFFYAPAVYQTWSKLYVLTEDGVLHSKYLNFMRPAIDERIVDFESFKATDYSWKGYQGLQEIDSETAKSTNLTRQRNWVSGYVSNK